MRYFCLCCEKCADLPGARPRCPFCNAAMAPEKELADIAPDGAPLISFSKELVYHLYCNCPNAYYCKIHDQYRPECEDLKFSPKCLHGLFATVESLSHRQERLEKALAQTDKILGSLYPLELSDRHIPEEPDG